MRILLDSKARIKPGAIIIEGFPGFGLVGTIATQFLVEHLPTRLVGRFEYDELPATTAIHNGRVVEPLAIHYAPKHNLLILHAMLAVKDYEWKAAEQIAALKRKIKAKEIISIEGVNTAVPNETPTVYCYGDARFEALGAQAMKESIIVGVTAALLLKAKDVKCLFANTHSGLPDSKAAAAVIAILNKDLKLGVDPAPLLKQAEEFEEKLRTLMRQSQHAQLEADRKNLSYLG